MLMKNSECEIPGCERTARSRWLCRYHLNRASRGVSVNPPTSAYEALVRQGFSQRGDCVIPRKGIAVNGYARVGFQYERLLSHRVSFECWNGPIPDGLVVDHTCHNEAVDRGECGGGACHHRACVNPAHLRAVTSTENIRSSSLNIWNQRRSRTSCPNGHDYDEVNTQVRKDGGRGCRRCGGWSG